MRKIKNLMLLLLMALVMLISVPFAFANQEILFKTDIDVGYWDIWRHADGVTWQHTGKPGDEKSYEFSIPQQAEASNYDNIRFEMVVGVSENDFIQTGGWQGYNTADWEKFGIDFLKREPDGYCKTGEKQVSFTLSPVENAETIKKQEQAGMVEGWRWYLPATIYWYGARKALPDFEAVSLVPGTEETTPGVAYTGKVVYELKDTYGEPVNAGITLTHNGFSIINEVREFEPGLPQEFEFNWTGQAADSLFRAEIWPTEPSDQPKESRDAEPEDNVVEVIVKRAGYKLTVLKTGEGTITPPEGEYLYPANEQVDLSATPAPGWKFVRWEGDVSGTNPNTHIVMDRDKKIRAVFDKVMHTLTIRANPDIGGTTNPAPGVYKYKHGETVNIKATANQDWKFVRWTGNASGTNPSTNVLMDRDKVVIAQFEQDFLAPMDPGDPGGVGPPGLLPKP